MKRFLLILITVMMTIMPLSTVNAINLDVESPHMLADMMPEGTDFFFATRIGEDFIAELDAISLALYAQLPDSMGIQPYSLNDVIRQSLAEEDVDWDQLSAILGDYAAMGLEIAGDLSSEPLTYVVIQITDQQAAADYFETMIAEVELNRTTEGDNIVYMSPEGDDGKLIVTPSHLLFFTVMDFNGTVETPLSSTALFSRVMGTLNADAYNMVGLLSDEFMQAVITESDNSGDLSAMGINPADAGAAAFGLTILDGATFTIDFAIETAASAPASTVSVDILGALPAGTDAFVMGSDFTGTFQNTLAAISAAAVANGEDDPSAQIPMLFGMTGLDLEEEVLSWTTGTYGIFFGADFAALLDEMLSSGTLSSINLDAGLVIEATDAAQASNTAQKLGEFITAMGGNEEGLTITQEGDYTSIVIEMPIDPTADPLQLELVITATDTFFFMGTSQSYQALLAGETLAGNADFTSASNYFLPDATSVWYINADGFVSSTAIPLAIMGPAIGNIFDNVVAELNGDMSGSDDDMSSPSPLDMLGDPAVVGETLTALDNMFSNATISSSIDAEGVVRFRATMTVNP